MDEGLDQDDKYRMVEDEFLSIAKKFTVHLHAAEYQRQKKLARSQNAEKINSISRPVAGRMPDQTRRKIESVTRANNQLTTLQEFLGKQSETAGDSDNSADGDALPYIGTSLHGLMDSPRRRASSLAKIGPTATTTRAAAGFRKPAAHAKPHLKAMSQSPPKAAVDLSQAQNLIGQSDSLTESSYDDDDLDAPIPAPKLTMYKKSDSGPSNPLPSPVLLAAVGSSAVLSSRRGYMSCMTGASSNTNSRITKRLEQVRVQKANQAQEEQKKRKLDIIPTF